MLLYPGNCHMTLPHWNHQARGNCPSQNLRLQFQDTFGCVHGDLWREMAAWKPSVNTSSLLGVAVTDSRSP